jgi:hypothetical protein
MKEIISLIEEGGKRKEERGRRKEEGGKRIDPRQSDHIKHETLNTARS